MTQDECYQKPDCGHDANHLSALLVGLGQHDRHVVGQLRKRLPEGEYRGPQDVLSALRKGR